MKLVHLKALAVCGSMTGAFLGQTAIAIFNSIYLDVGCALLASEGLGLFSSCDSHRCRTNSQAGGLPAGHSGEG